MASERSPLQEAEAVARAAWEGALTRRRAVTLLAIVRAYALAMAAGVTASAVATRLMPQEQAHRFWDIYHDGLLQAIETAFRRAGLDGRARQRAFDLLDGLTDRYLQEFDVLMKRGNRALRALQDSPDVLERG